MTSFTKILSGAAGIALIAGAAAPAAAQSNYGGYNQGYAQSGGVVGAVINSVLGGGRYGTYGQGPDRVAVDRCARSAEAQVARDYRARGYGQYSQGYNQGYGQQGYHQANVARVVAITAVERRRNGVKVSGVIDSGMNRYRGAYGQGYGTPGFPNQAYPNQAYGNQGYGNQGYPNQGYPYPAYPNQGYGNPYAQNAPADLRFSCRVDYRGYVSNIEINRNVAQRRGF